MFSMLQPLPRQYWADANGRFEGWKGYSGWEKNTHNYSGAPYIFSLEDFLGRQFEL